PEITQPLMYQTIALHPTLYQLYRDNLLKQGVVTDAEVDEAVAQYRLCMTRMKEEQSGKSPSRPNSLRGRWHGFTHIGAEEPTTTVAADTLQSLAEQVYTFPEGFTLSRQVSKIFMQRIEMMRGDTEIDWGCAEAMAYASLVQEGGWVRISGQDSGRGTFAHRHAIVYDQKTGRGLMPIRKVENGPLSHFIVIDSMLSEAAVMAFEYGYSIAEPRALVIWEAQFGDFANNAQVIIDQFITSGESKWRRMSGLVLWLPHGYEGQGGEHSSARLERFLQLAAEDNIQVVNPTTPAQLFHLLRRQYLIKTRKPLILFSPKSLLRKRLTFSSLVDLTSGGFQPLLAESLPAVVVANVQRVLLCSGKVYYDLFEAREILKRYEVAIVRIESLYPFPKTMLIQEMAKYHATTKVLWVQEEPENQGAWYQIKHHLKRSLLPTQKLYHISRAALAAPASGSSKRHAMEQQLLLDRALTL
ncbi:MAG: 2-oxoglutarate dehydrogenase E1 component, partial [Zetaproteobacteria bacterium]|nr:2-oxoglutarate dehydrogenase E1 component [Zetaproteobacteria bacterium]